MEIEYLRKNTHFCRIWVPVPHQPKQANMCRKTFNFTGILWPDKTKDKYDRITIGANNEKPELISGAPGSGFKFPGESGLGSTPQINASLPHIRHNILKLQKL
jgi:hypothetical protein